MYLIGHQEFVLSSETKFLSNILRTLHLRLVQWTPLP
jgi:hypothetical protein